MLKNFISYYKPHKRLFIIDIICAFFIALCNLFYPFITKNIINDYVPNQQLQLLIVWCAALLLIFIIKTGLTYWVQYWGHVLGVRIQGDMRRDMFRHIQRLPFSYFDANKTGALMSKMVNDLFDISELAHHGPEDLFLSLITIIGAFIMLAFTNIWLTLIVFAFLPLIVLFAARTRSRMKRSFKKMREEVAKINAGIETSISGVRVTKAYAGEDYEEKKFCNLNEDYKSARGDAYKAMGIFHSGMGLMTDVLYLVVLAAGGLFFYFGLIDIGEFAAFILYIVMLINPIKSLINIFEQVQSGMTGFVRFREVMNQQPEQDAEGALDVMPEGDIVFDDVSFAYNGKDAAALNGLSFTVKQGESVALVGESGCGKTTVCHILERFYDISGGTITVGGESLSSIKRSALREKVGLVAQDVFIFDGTIKENIAYGRLDAGENEIMESAKRANIHDYIMTLPEGYETPVGERGVKLSGGQRQRISIARAFLKDPPVLMLDEATSALDNTTEAQIQRSLDELCEGRTTIIVAHRLSTIQNADKIVVMDKGKVVEQGTHAQLKAANGRYAKLYNSISGNEN